MKGSVLRLFVISVLLINFPVDHVESLEPVSIFAFYDWVKCKLNECCNSNWVTTNVKGLKYALEEKLHGQHLVTDSVLRFVKGHSSNNNPGKALVLSFHGWTGGGKNFVSKIIANNLFARGMESKFVHLFVSTLHFPHAKQVETYKDQLREWIKGNVTLCSRSMFIFDEMDKMPEGLINTIKPFIDHYEEINGVDYRKSIFLFLSNTGGNSITQYTLEHWKHSKEDRENIRFKDLEDLITQSAFNEEGGLWHSSLIEKNLVSAFIPFLPMEREHIKLCIRDDLKAKRLPVSEEILSKVADELSYFPKDLKLFSTTGCKRVTEKVDFVAEEFIDNEL